jgi:hypothetical protein
MAASDGGRSAATRQALMAKYEMPITATRPVLHGWSEAHSMQS